MNRRQAMQTLMAMPAVTSIAHLEAKANDVIVVECEGMLSNKHKENIRLQLLQIWPNQKIVVLDNQMRLKVVRS